MRLVVGNWRIDLRIVILLGVAAVFIAIIADVYAPSSNVALESAPYDGMGPVASPVQTEGRAAYVDPSRRAVSPGDVNAPDAGASVSHGQ